MRNVDQEAASEKAATKAGHALTNLLGRTSHETRCLELKVSVEGGGRYFVVLKAVGGGESLVAFRSVDDLLGGLAAIERLFAGGGLNWQVDAYPSKVQRMLTEFD